MLKRKRKELTDVIDGPKTVQTKKIKSQNNGNNLFKVSKSLQSPEIKDTTGTIISKPQEIRIIVGSYEKVLCGINAKFEPQSTDKVCLFPTCK